MIPSVTVSYWGVIVAAIAAQVLGALWYSPILFGKQWMKETGFTTKGAKKAKEKGMGKSYLISLISSLVMAYVLAIVLGYSTATGLGEGLFVAFIVWIGFFATVMVGNVLWENKSLNLYYISVGYWLVNLLIMSMILLYL